MTRQQKTRFYTTAQQHDATEGALSSANDTFSLAPCMVITDYIKFIMCELGHVLKGDARFMDKCRRLLGIINESI